MYEYIDDDIKKLGKTLQTNTQNNKACDIKVLMQDTTWTVPEEEGGLIYNLM
jgi:hypothetical protein